MLLAITFILTRGSSLKVITLKDYGIERMEDIHHFLNRCLDQDAVDKELFSHITKEDPNFNPELTFIALENDNLIGVLIGVERTKEPKEAIEQHQRTAWIKVLAVDPLAQNRDEALDKLLSEFIEVMKTRGKEEVRYADFASWYLFPGLDLSYEYYLIKLLKRGFTKVGECVDYEVDLLHFRIPRRVHEVMKSCQAKNILFRRGVRGEENAVSKWVFERFGPFWKIETLMAYTRRERPTIWLALRGDEVLGFSCYSALHIDWFGPIGVDVKARRLGIGTVLLFKSLEDMHLMGRRIIRIPWTSHLFFYSQVPNVVRIRHYWQLQLKLK